LPYLAGWPLDDRVEEFADGSDALPGARALLPQPPPYQLGADSGVLK